MTSIREQFSSSGAATSLAGYCAWAASALFRGFSISYLPLIPAITLLGMTQGSQLFPFILCCSVLGLLSVSVMPWAVLVSGLLASVCGENLKIRVTGFITVAIALWITPVSASVPMVLVAAAGAFTARHRLALFLIPAGFLVSVFTAGLPASVAPDPVVASSVIKNGILRYELPELNSSVTHVVLPAPFQGDWAVWVELEAGGVRDSLPMMALGIGEEILMLPSGRDTLSFMMHPGDSLTVILMRHFKPFNHPAVHVSAGGELL